MFELKGKEMNMLADIQGGRATLRNLGSKQNKLDEETLKQQEILYTQVLSILLSFDFCLAVVYIAQFSAVSPCIVPWTSSHYFSVFSFTCV